MSDPAPAGSSARHQPTASSLLAGSGKHEVLRRLELTITRRLDGLLHGDYRGLVPGHGSDPGETRAYQPGDDVRLIDWNVTARMVTPHIRETIADRELETWVMIDLSPSLSFGTADCEKRDVAIAAFGAVGFLTARTGNRIGAVIADSQGHRSVPAKSGRTHLLALLSRALDHVNTADTSAGTTDLATAVSQLAVPNHRRGLAIVISDFLSNSDWSSALRTVTARHETIAVEVLDPRELELPDVGMITLVDPETGRRRDVRTSSAKLRADYAAAAENQRAEHARLIAAAGADHLVLRTDQDWLMDLVRFLAARRERAALLARQGA